MKITANKPLLYTLTSLALISASTAHASRVTAPTLEGGISASIGALYLVPSADGQDYAVSFSESSDFNTEYDNVVEVNPGYDFGFEASLGYVFDETANGVELLYRVINTSENDSVASTDSLLVETLDGEDDIASASSDLKYDLNAVDLMFNQFMDIGNAVQMRFSLGASYLNLKKEQNSYYHEIEFVANTSDSELFNTKFSGFGPRIATDARYDFGQGFGILAGGSLAYYVGDMHVTNKSISTTGNDSSTFNTTDDLDNHAVTNLRANIGIDYVYFFDNEASTLGLELGYLVDYYADAIQQFNASDAQDSNSLSFSGPYLNLKGVF